MTLSDNTLRKLFKFPIIWRWAVKKALAREHERFGGCIVCDAEQRLKHDQHVIFMAVSGNFICRNCNKPMSEWAESPVCSHKRPPAQPEQIPQPRYRIIPTDVLDMD